MAVKDAVKDAVKGAAVKANKVNEVAGNNRCELCARRRVNSKRRRVSSNRRRVSSDRRRVSSNRRRVNNNRRHVNSNRRSVAASHLASRSDESRRHSETNRVHRNNDNLTHRLTLNREGSRSGIAVAGIKCETNRLEGTRRRCLGSRALISASAGERTTGRREEGSVLVETKDNGTIEDRIGDASSSVFEQSTLHMSFVL